MTRKINCFSVAFIMFFSILCMALISPTRTYAAENVDGCWGYVPNSTSVYQMKNLTQRIGSLSATEGFTVLGFETNSYYIEYSTSNGAKRGYIAKNSAVIEHSETCAGRMYSSQTVYYGHTGSNTLSAGSVSAGEYVAVLARNGNWVYIEYNTTSGRKRGYVPYSSVNIFPANAGINNLRNYWHWHGYSPEWASYGSSRTVYRVPNTLGSSDGSISATENIRICSAAININGQNYYLIEYWYGNSGLIKSGYIKQ